MQKYCTQDPCFRLFFFPTEYLTNVLDDLGLQTSETLTQIDTLLKAKPEDFSDKAEVMPQRISHTIASMRGIEV